MQVRQSGGKQIAVPIGSLMAILALIVANHMAGGALTRWDAVATNRPPDPSPPPFSIQGAWREIGAHTLPINATPRDPGLPDQPTIAGGAMRDAEPAPEANAVIVAVPITDAAQTILPSEAPPSPQAAAAAPPVELASTTPPEVATPAIAGAPTADTAQTPTAPDALAADTVPTPSEAPPREPIAAVALSPAATSADDAAEPLPLPTLALLDVAPAEIVTTAAAIEPVGDANAPARTVLVTSAPSTAPAAPLAPEQAKPIAPAPPVLPLPRRKPDWLIEKARRLRSEATATTAAAVPRPTLPVRPAKVQATEPATEAPARSGLFHGLGHASP